MHVPKMFAITDDSIIEQFIKDNGFATLITSNADFPVGTHLPVELEINEEGNKVLRGHIAKANPQWEQFEREGNVLVIFLSSVHSYISSSWYGQPNAPTWNYLSVHVSGKIKIIEGEALWNTVKNLTKHYEQHSANPVSLDALPNAVQQYLNEVVGFEISIIKIEAAFKLSQNRNDTDYKNIIKQLRLSEQPNENLMADIMETQRGLK